MDATEDTTRIALSDLAARISGQAFPAHKAYLMEARLSAIVRREGLTGLDDLVRCLGARPNPVFENEIAAALVAKNSEFFKDRSVLERIVADIAPAAMSQRPNEPVRIWCAGGGSGQEAISLAILAEEAGLEADAFEILSTDFCKTSVERARSGRFGHFDVQRGLSIHRLLAGFDKEADGVWVAKPHLRARISFREHNLMSDMTGLGQFDVILCRDVLTAMRGEARRAVIDNLSRQLKPGGVAFFGPSEDMAGVSPALHPSRDIRGGFQIPSAADALKMVTG